VTGPTSRGCFITEQHTCPRLNQDTILFGYMVSFTILNSPDCRKNRRRSYQAASKENGDWLAIGAFYCTGSRGSVKLD
jgi:hypothetical protein